MGTWAGLLPLPAGKGGSAGWALLDLAVWLIQLWTGLGHGCQGSLQSVIHSGQSPELIPTPRVDSQTPVHPGWLEAAVRDRGALQAHIQCTWTNALWFHIWAGKRFPKIPEKLGRPERHTDLMWGRGTGMVCIQLGSIEWGTPRTPAHNI